MIWTSTFAIIASIFLVIVIPVIVSILTDDAKSWLPRLATGLIRKAAMRLPGDYKREFYEEWISHCDEIPEISGKLWHAVTIYFWGASKVENALIGYRFAPRIYDYVKRAMDVSFVLLALPLILPLLSMIVFTVARDGGPAFYTQPRVGRDGKTYRVWKLRTMVNNADLVLGRYLRDNPHAAQEWAEKQRLRRDPRLTPIGRILRKCSLDELPQLWNVLVGDMSLVGPRPMMPNQVKFYPGKAYYAKRPGITGRWQVSERLGSTFEERAQSDAEYVESLSLKNDLKLLWKTVSVVFRGTGY